MSSVQEQAKTRFLATLEIARRELAVLDYSHGKLFSETIDANWVNSLSNDMDAAETLEAFVARFGRFQDTVGDKLVPRAQWDSGEPNSTVRNGSTITEACRLG